VLKFCVIVYFYRIQFFLGYFAKLRKVTISFVISLCPSVCPRRMIPIERMLITF